MGIYFLRHAQTAYNAQQRLSGRSDIDILPGQHILLPDNCPVFSAVYCSCAKRCKQTLALVPPDRIASPVVYTDLLLERSFGVLEGMLRQDAIDAYPDLFANRQYRVDRRAPNGESAFDVYDRVLPLAQKIRRTPGDILICAHNQSLKAMAAALKEAEITEEAWGGYHFRNAEIVKII